MITQTKAFILDGLKQSLGLYWTIFKIILPVMIVVRFVIVFDFHILLARLLSPMMTLVGLPAETGIIFVTTMIVGLYGGAAVMVSLLPTLELSVAQVTVLTTLMVVAHALPIEQQIVKRAGIPIIIATVFRFIMAMLLGAILFHSYAFLNVLQTPIDATWLPDIPINAAWDEWFKNTGLSLFYMFWIILSLIFILKLFDVTGATKLITKVLAPFLSIMGISKDATTLTMTGVMLGLAFGGGLIVREAQAGTLGHRTIFQSVIFMALCHGLIEDTLYALLLGGHISGIFFARVIFAVVTMIIINKIVRAMPDRLFYRYLFIKPKEQ